MPPAAREQPRVRRTRFPKKVRQPRSTIAESHVRRPSEGLSKGSPPAAWEMQSGASNAVVTQARSISASPALFIATKHMVTALLSRLRHQCTTIRIDGPSLREPQG